MARHKRGVLFTQSSLAECDCTRPLSLDYRSSHGCPVHDPEVYSRLYSTHRNDRT